MGNGMISGRKLSPRELLILAFLLLLFIVGCEAAWIAGLREHLRVRQTIVAGTTRRQIEAEFGEPRWTSRPGQPLSEFGWNGQEKDVLSESERHVYDASIFTFVICEFDEHGTLKKAVLSKK